MVQRDEVTVCHSLFEPDQQNQSCFPEHRDHASRGFGIVFTLELTKSIEDGSVEHSLVRAGSLHCVPNHQRHLAVLPRQDDQLATAFSLTTSALPRLNLRKSPSIASSMTVISASSTSNAVS